MKLALGTVQFGLDYGVTNTSGQVKKDEVSSILNYSFENGIDKLDTATAYGNSESILGELALKEFKVISKIPKIQSLKADIYSNIERSLNNLNRNELYGLMLHDENDLLLNTKPYLDLISAKKNGLVKKIGCSFYTTEALLKYLNDENEIDIIQIPVNCLDQRFVKSGALQLAKDRKIEIHCRSLFLQGLLLNENATLPEAILSHQNDLHEFFNFCREHNLTPLEATLKYLQQLDCIDFGVVGCISQQQIFEIVESYKKAQRQSTSIDFSELSSVTTALLNPSMWK